MSNGKLILTHRVVEDEKTGEHFLLCTYAGLDPSTFTRESEMKKNTTTVPWPKTGKGSGPGPWLQGERIKHVNQLNTGDLLIEHSPQFGATNVTRIVEVFPSRDKVYGEFVNPDKPAEPRIWSNGTFCIWDFDVTGGGTVLHRAVPSQPQERKE